MKGLYVYGSLLMALSFVAGVVQGISGLCALAIASCALAALSEAIDEVNQNLPIKSQTTALERVQATAALASWVVTAITAIFAFLSFI